MSLVQKILAHKKFRLAVGLLAFAFIAILVAAWKLGFTIEAAKTLWVESKAYLESNPWAMFLALAVLPGLPVPLSALLVIAGIVWGPNLNACLWMLLALAINMTWTYWLAAYPARRLIEKLLAQTSIKIPELPKNDHLRLILILRLTPGLPMFIHNYILGFFRTPFLLYLALSMVLAGGIACGILLTGGALLEGSTGAAITGIMLIVVGALAIKILRTRLAKKSSVNGHPGITEPPVPLENAPEPEDPAAGI